MKELLPGSPHPAAIDALSWIRSQPGSRLAMFREAFASCAIEGNELAGVCGETLRRIMADEPVGDRYVLGLERTMRFGEKKTRRAKKL